MPKTEDDYLAIIARVEAELWKAILVMPKHRHNTAAKRKNCDVCKAREYLSRAYQALPPESSAPQERTDKVNYKVVNYDEGDESP